MGAVRKTPDLRLALWRGIPALALMGLIFFLSSQSDLDSGLGWIDLVGRKLVHAGTYATLAFLIARGIDPLGMPRPRTLAIAAALALLYAISDEWHQSFVEGRVGSPIDVGIDAAGIAIFLAAHQRSPLLRSAVSRPMRTIRPG